MAIPVPPPLPAASAPAVVRPASAPASSMILSDRIARPPPRSGLRVCRAMSPPFRRAWQGAKRRSAPYLVAHRPCGDAHALQEAHGSADGRDRPAGTRTRDSHGRHALRERPGPEGTVSRGPGERLLRHGLLLGRGAGLLANPWRSRDRGGLPAGDNAQTPPRGRPPRAPRATGGRGGCPPPGGR